MSGARLIVTRRGWYDSDAVGIDSVVVKENVSVGVMLRYRGLRVRL